MRPAPFPTSDRADVAGLITLVAGGHLELHSLTLGERAEPVHLDRRMVDEYIRPFVPCDEPVALVVVEPLHRARRHARAPFLRAGPASAPRSRHHSPRGTGCLPSWMRPGPPPFGGGSTITEEDAEHCWPTAGGRSAPLGGCALVRRLRPAVRPTSLVAP